MADSPNRTRRSFLNTALGGGVLGWLASLLYPIFTYLKPPAELGGNVDEVKVGPATDVANNSGQIVRFGREPVILIRTDNGELRALSATCTHLDCTVQYRDDRKDIWCACHNGVYDLQGNNVSGPPPRPLAPFAVNVVDGDIMISR